MGAIGPSDFSRQATRYGQASGDHASSRIDRDDTESGRTANLPTPPSLPPRPLAGMLHSATSEVRAGCRGPF